MELGIYTFAELTPGEHDGATATPAQRLRDLVEEIELADQVGLDVFGVGEHHRPDFAVSAPAVVLAAAAERTRTIRLSSAVTVLSSDDPVRVFQEFATLDLLSGGRAEIMAGRGSFIESFPLFGYRARRLRLAVRREARAAARAPRVHARDVVGPAPGAARRPRRVPASGAGPASDLGRRRRHARVGAARRALGLPMALAIIGGMPERFAPFAELHRRAAAEAGHPRPALSINSHGFVATTSQQAADESFPTFAAAMNRIGRERGWPPMTPRAVRCRRARCAARASSGARRR